MKEYTDTIREITRKVAKTRSPKSLSKMVQTGLEIFHTSSSEEEYIRRMKEAFPEAFKDEEK